MTGTWKRSALLLLASFLLICGAVCVRPVMRYRALCRLNDHGWSVVTRYATPDWLPKWIKNWSDDFWVTVPEVWSPPSNDDEAGPYVSDLYDCLPWIPEVESIHLRSFPGMDDRVLALQSCRNLKSLDVGYSGLTDRGVKTIATLTSLEGLDLSGNPLSDEGLRKLAASPGLKYLRLSHSYMDPLDSLISGAGFDAWTDCNLEVLQLYETQITDDSIKHLRRFRKIRRLDLSRTRITDAAIDMLVDLPELEELNVDVTQITNSAVRKLAGVKSLNYLTLSETAIDDEAIGYLADHPKLHSLSITSTKVSDRCVADLIRIPRLFALCVGETALTPAGFAQLAQCRKLEWLEASDTAIDAEAIEALLRSPKLKQISLTRRQMDEPAIARLASQGRGQEVLFSEEPPYDAPSEDDTQ